MKGTILEKIVEAKRIRVNVAKRSSDADKTIDYAKAGKSNRQSHRFRNVLADRLRTNIIAEFKKASPSKGSINEAVNAAFVAKQYQVGGAAAISVLTEEDFFKGSLEDLSAVRTAVDLPILRKDFVFDPFQIYEAAAAGAAAILLIAAMLDDDQLTQLRELAEEELGLDALVEVHTLDELERAKTIGARLIGVNNRDLKSFHVTLDVSRELIKYAPSDAIMIAESGLITRDNLLELHELGYSGFLIGETLMKSGDPTTSLKNLTTENTKNI